MEGWGVESVGVGAQGGVGGWRPDQTEQFAANGNSHHPLITGGFLCIMLNFNHERWMIAACILGNLRLVLQECILWLNQRKAFGKSLTEQPVLRFKLGEMIAGLEALQGERLFLCKFCTNCKNVDR